MKIDCKNGFFIISEDRPGQVSDFMRYTGLNLVKFREFWTFEGLETVPEYSLVGAPFMGLVASKTYQGEPWDLYDQNQVVFNFNLGVTVPLVSVTNQVKISQAGNKYISNGLIVPGSILANGKKVKSYSGYFSRDTLNFSYSEVESG